MDVDQKTPDPLHVGDPNDLGDAWVWRAIAWPSRWRGVQPRSLPSSPMTAPLHHHLSPEGLVARVSHHVGDSIQSGVRPRLTHGVRQGGLVKDVGASSWAPLKSSQRFLAANQSTPLLSNVTTAPRLRAMDDASATHVRIRRTPLTGHHIVIWKMRCAMVFDRICPCAWPSRNQSTVAGGPSEPQPWGPG